MKPYQRGDVVIIDVPMLANSHIQAGKRPWVVVQNNVGNQFSSTSIVVPLTTKSSGWNCQPMWLSLGVLYNRAWLSVNRCVS